MTVFFNRCCLGWNRHAIRDDRNLAFRNMVPYKIIFHSWSEGDEMGFPSPSVATGCQRHSPKRRKNGHVRSLADYWQLEKLSSKNGQPGNPFCGVDMENVK